MALSFGYESTLHRVLEIPEIVELIFAFMDEKDNANNACVCKRCCWPHFLPWTIPLPFTSTLSIEHSVLTIGRDSHVMLAECANCPLSKIEKRDRTERWAPSFSTR
ncbi:hypothetical protein AcW1_003169 [Taiwanofungus camphoratus]|nr:hypothetical protein AcW1_003169 [Antrodia cinnamomea]